MKEDGGLLSESFKGHGASLSSLEDEYTGCPLFLSSSMLPFISLGSLTAQQGVKAQGQLSQNGETGLTDGR